MVKPKLKALIADEHVRIRITAFIAQGPLRAGARAKREQCNNQKSAQLS